MNVRFISITKPEITINGTPLSPEGLIAYCARVSSPNQENPNYTKLLQFCIRQGHWSVFEMVDMTLEITTTRAIASQILRHRSFSFQEFSQRYAKASAFEIYEARRQDHKNRQNSLNDLDEATKQWFRDAQNEVWAHSFTLYEKALEKGIAKESARMLLPLNTVTRMYMKGSVRSWIHYFQVRCDDATQKEHRDIALAARDIFIQHFPTIAEALSWASLVPAQNGTFELLK
ncbi:MAG: FAD-dependent thymidylate synthase [Chloroherpetonaceae bacterium]